MTHKRSSPEGIRQELAALADIYAPDDSADWTITIEPWTLTATPDIPVVSVLWNDWPTGEIGADYAEIFAPGIADGAQQLRRDLHQHVYQYRRLRRIPHQELLIPFS
jgi:hypothetical protein